MVEFRCDVSGSLCTKYYDADKMAQSLGGIDFSTYDRTSVVIFGLVKLFFVTFSLSTTSAILSA